MATKAHEQNDKVGRIKLTERQKEIIAVGVESDFFKVILAVQPQILTKIAVASLNLSQDDKDLFYYKGRAYQATNLIQELQKVAKDFNETNGDAEIED